eukprot:SAG11_NODE_1437_length_4909_cov_2.303742_2_plen_445_part_00
MLYGVIVSIVYALAACSCSDTRTPVFATIGIDARTSTASSRGDGEGAGPSLSRVTGGGMQWQLFAAAEEGEEELVRHLLEGGANPNDCGLFGLRPLHLASRHARLGVVSVLLESGARPNRRSRSGSTALHEACGHWLGDSRLQSLAAGGEGAWAAVAEDGGARVAHSQTQWGAADGCTADRLAVAKLLLRRGADVDSADRHGATALLAAVRRGWAPMVRVLLHRGADSTRADELGTTAQTLAGTLTRSAAARAWPGVLSERTSLASDTFPACVSAGAARRCLQLLQEEGVETRHGRAVLGARQRLCWAAATAHRRLGGQRRCTSRGGARGSAAAALALDLAETVGLRLLGLGDDGLGSGDGGKLGRRRGGASRRGTALAPYTVLRRKLAEEDVGDLDVHEHGDEGGGGRKELSEDHHRRRRRRRQRRSFEQSSEADAIAAGGLE